MSNPYNNSYELKNYNKYSSSGSGEDDFVSFMNEINDINNTLDQYSNLINLISNKQRNFVHELDLNEEDAEYNSKQIDALISESNSLQSDLKSRIKNVQAQAASSHDKNKIDQAESSRKRFLELIQEYRLIEANNREQTKAQAERQYRIIKPDATDAELKAVVEDGDNQQYFQQALMQSNRRGEARTVLNEVQVRHRELLKLEKTMAELTQLFHDMEELVIEQDQPIQQIDEQIGAAQHDVEQGVGHTNKAVVSAKKARKKRCICFGIIVLIIIILAVILGAYFGVHH
ncbi:Piso0_002999 [Millerozyma farinosa CBS 7064]|uniref:Piso0_002999 protein n=1 Tax=Pichia sorbitophila (strain ATCC MYA-4447 / BCRC 22081 / CBS 7064 / NBRC 10061 / NRRL Y-12695) TaxID=559304 RepID=G8YK27_PICSO|nr:Piso0_002999 [Millerozyma farinosa CBS 7064]CCE80672.1 Piso0_002999 [Millerozyma farinosa CBS 7064]